MRRARSGHKRGAPTTGQPPRPSPAGHCYIKPRPVILTRDLPVQRATDTASQAEPVSAMTGLCLASYAVVRVLSFRPEGSYVRTTASGSSCSASTRTIGARRTGALTSWVASLWRSCSVASFGTEDSGCRRRCAPRGLRGVPSDADALICRGAARPLLPRPARCLPVAVAAVLVTLSSSLLIAWPVAAASADLTPVPMCGRGLDPESCPIGTTGCPPHDEHRAGHDPLPEGSRFVELPAPAGDSPAVAVPTRLPDRCRTRMRTTASGGPLSGTRLSGLRDEREHLLDLGEHPDRVVAVDVVPAVEYHLDRV